MYVVVLDIVIYRFWTPVLLYFIFDTGLYFKKTAVKACIGYEFCCPAVVWMPVTNCITQNYFRLTRSDHFNNFTLMGFIVLKKSIFKIQVCSETEFQNIRRFCSFFFTKLCRTPCTQLPEGEIKDSHFF